MICAFHRGSGGTRETYLVTTRPRVVDPDLSAEAELENAGQHNILFDASHLASGIYYYELRTGDFKSVKKFILIK